MKMKKITMILFALVVITTCHVVPNMFIVKAETATYNVPDQNFSVKTFVKGNDVYIECYVRDYQFTQLNQKELASISVFIDGKKHSERNTAAFIIKDIPNGVHTIKLELMKDKKKKIGLTKEFDVHIQSAI
jgi:hypothetical protein